MMVPWAFTLFLQYLYTFTLQYIHPVVLVYYFPSPLPVVTLSMQETQHAIHDPSQYSACNSERTV